ncbi:hypothetical protein BDZ97DRAFT_1838744 [Flammula alnicola]|nr:hypothetical protein BDZ97DRAFT_1838744 [Flammula alnicola]
MSSSGSAVYEGSRRKLVVAFDVGTTFSGISYSVLDPGQVPIIKGVTRFPAQGTIGGASKIPTVIYYDKLGKVCAIGAETTRDGIDVEAQEHGWVKAQWFKLHLRTKSKLRAKQNVDWEIYPLPPKKEVINVFADFLRYLLACTFQYIQDTHVNGPDLWESAKGDISYVLSHPNGWEGIEQDKMRRAAVIAGLIPDTLSGRARLSLVTEGEASLHFAIRAGILAEAMSSGQGVIIVDAGGGTVDLSAYGQKPEELSQTFEEIAAPQCLFNGSVYVSVYAKKFLLGLLEDSPFINDVEDIVNIFDRSTKLRFKDAEEPQYIKFGTTRDNDVNCNIRFGQLKLAGSDIARFFQPAIDCIIQAVLEQRKTATQKISHVLMVGGFAASDWLFRNVSKAMTEQALGLNVVRPEEHVNKAVADGAISFFLDHFVRTRISKVTYGCFCVIPYIPTDPEHLQRSGSTIVRPNGLKHVQDSFKVVLPKNTQVSEAKEFRESFQYASFERSSLKDCTLSVWCYRGLNLTPRWKDIDKDNYSSTCTVTADFSSIPVKCLYNPQGRIYYQINCDIVIFFGLTEMNAQIAWTNSDGVEQRSPATIVYDPELEVVIPNNALLEP